MDQLSKDELIAMGFPGLAKYSFASQREGSAAPPTPYTDEQLGFRADEDLRAGISACEFTTSQNALAVQIARNTDRIRKLLEQLSQPPTPAPNSPTT